MRLSKDVKYDRGGSADCQFYIWKLSKISENRKPSIRPGVIHQKEPIRITDADVLLDEIVFPSYSASKKIRSLHLSLKQTRILATLLPDAIINITDLTESSLDNFVGVLLFADISGFTPLCEKYNFGRPGFDKLTATLNNYLGAMIEVIYKHGGDVLKFSGDAILSLWKLQNNEFIYSLIHRVISCALFIQNSMGIYETELKVLLKVKLAISAGNMTFCLIGDNNSRQYVIVGSPVNEVKKAEQLCLSGEVVLSFSAWGHLSPVNYEHNWKDSEHVKIIRIIYNPENLKREILRAEKKVSFHRKYIQYSNLASKETYRKKFRNTNNISGVRSIVDEAAKRKLNSELRTFLIPSVIEHIDADLPLEYLSEMRNITVMFINIIPHKMHTKSLISMVDKAYIIICSFAYKAMGSVNKVSLFDKDVMVLIIFGLRGFNHEGEVAACLKCGYDIRQACCILDGVFCVSVGVTTGQAYCGVVGHPMRREYTVIGAAVNKAARIMCAYPGKVSCDKDTFLLSNLAASFFSIQERKHLKGIQDTGPIYEFIQEKSKNTLAAMYEGIYPILGREQEIQILQNILQSINNCHSWEKAVLIRGMARIGKSRLLDEIIVAAHSKGFIPIAIALYNVHSTLPYGTAQYIIKQVLEIPDSASMVDKQHRLLTILKNYVPLTDFWYLNEVMNVKFPENLNAATFDTAEKFERIKKLFHLILRVGTSSVIFAIDDIDCCDELSWKLLMSIIDERVKFLIMTMPKRLRPEIIKFLRFPPEIDQHIKKLSLAGLPNNVLAVLACQILNARAVPVELERILIAKSHGNPGWCESFLLSLSQSNVLKVEELPLWQVKNLGLIMPPEEQLRKKQYAATSDEKNFAKIEYEKSKDLTENQESISEGKTGEESVSIEKTTFTKLNKRKTDRKENENFKLVRNNTMQIEEAYENLKHRIKLVRSQLKVANIHSPDRNSSEDSFLESSYAKRKKTEELQVQRKSCSSENTSTSQKIHFNHTEKKSLKFMKDSSTAMCNISFKYKTSQIHMQNISKRHSAKSDDNSDVCEPEYQEVTSSQDVRQEEIPSVSSTKSSALVANQYEHTENNFEGKSKPKIGFPVEVKEFSPSILWNSYTQFQIDESVEIFVKNKMKRDRGRAGNVTETSKMDSVASDGTQNILSSTIIDTKQALESNALSKEFNSRLTLKEETSTSKASKEQRLSSSKKMNSSFDDQKTLQANKKMFEGIIRDVEDLPEKHSNQGLSGKNVAHPDAIRGPKAEGSAEGVQEPFTGNKDLHEVPHDDLDGKRKLFELSEVGEHKSRSLLGKFKEWIKKGSESGGLTSSRAPLPIVEEEKNETLSAIIINPKIKMEEIYTPECFVGVIMSVLDCLGPYEQLLLKCGSIIGDRFTRRMLSAIMHTPSPILTSEAIKKLFEMKILCCGSDENEYDREDVNTNQCDCRLSSKDIVDDTLPKYSFCKVLLFKYSLFRSTLYELIPQDQKREFHIRATKFLEKEQIFCPFCETLSRTNQIFSNTMPPVQELGSLSNERKLKRFRSDESFNDISNIRSVFQRGAKKKTSLKGITLPDLLPSFQKCECLEFQADQNKQLINHCVAAGLKEKEIDFVIKYSSIMISLGEFHLANRLLLELDASLKTPTGNRITNKKEKHMIMGRIHLHLGQLNMEMNMSKKAYFYLLSALKYFGSRVVFLYPFRSLQFMYQYAIQVLYQKSKKNSTIKVKPFGNLEDSIGICLSLLSNVFMLQEKWEFAKIVSIRSLNLLLRNNRNLIELCNAYSNAIDVYRYLGDFKFCRRLEASAVKNCINLCTFKNVFELIALGRLICSIFNARLISGYLYGASKLGEFVVKISRSISSNIVESYIIPKIVQNMMMTGKLNKAAGFILLLPSTDIWHYILSLDFVLETGFEVVKSDLCLQEISNAIEYGLLDADVRTRAISTVYVWMSRLGKFQEAESWSGKLPLTLNVPLSGSTVTNMITVLKILEGDMINLGSVLEQERRNNPLNKKVTAALKSLKKSSKTAQIMLPRYLHLRAYYQYISNDLTKALVTMAHAKKFSVDQGNLLEQSWISHNERVWLDTCDFDKDLWLNAVRNKNMLKWTENHDVVRWSHCMYGLK